jgi:WD40 repeat protein
LADSVGNPYVGPRTFEEKEGHLFFGREREARDLLWLVMSEPMTLFYAPSGAGKSSLINTRLVPGLRREGFEVLPIGRVSGELPEDTSEVKNIFVFNLLLSLAESHKAIEKLTHTSLNEYLAQTRPSEPEQSIDRLDDDARPSRVLIIDQFEEIFTVHLDRWQERRKFFRELRHALRSDPFLWVVLTVREDYLASLDPYARLLPGKLRARFHMERMDYQAALEAVKRPARAYGRPFAPEVAEKLVDNLRQVQVHGQLRPHLGEFVEPVQLQVVCYQLWENLRGRPPAEITHTDVHEMGDVDKALAGYYEQAIAQVLQETGESEIQLRMWFNHELITETGTRGTVYRGVERTGGLVNQTVDLLASQFLLRADIRAGGTWYELVHDRFVEPIQHANGNWLLQQDQLVKAALAWQESGHDEGLLYRGQQLKWALTRVGGRRLEPPVPDFLGASKKLNQDLEEKEALRRRELEQAQALAEAERKRAEVQARATKRLRRLTIIVAFIFLLAVVAAVYAWTLQQRAQTAEAQALSAKLAAQAQTAMIENRPQRSLLLAVEAMNLALEKDNVPSPATENVLWATLSNAGGLGLGGHNDSVTAVAISPSNQWLVTAGGTTARLWNLTDSNNYPRILQIQEGRIRLAAISPDNRWLVVASDRIAYLWDLTDLDAHMRALPSHKDSITALAVSPDSRRLAIASLDEVIRVWNLAETGIDPVTLPVPGSSVNVMEVSPDNRWLITGNQDGTTYMWELTNLDAKPLVLPGGENSITAIALSPDGRLLAAGSDDTYVWDLTHPEPATTRIELPSDSFVNALAFSPDNRWLVTGNENGTAQVRDVTNLEPQPTYWHGHEGAISKLVVSPDSRWLVIGGRDHIVRVWDLDDRDADPIVLHGHDDRITDITVSADSRWLVTGSADGTARLWDVSAPNPATAAPIVLPVGEDFALADLAIAPDSRWLVTAGGDGTLRLWDLASADASVAKGPTPSPIIPSDNQGSITTLAISPNNRWLVTGDNNGGLSLWDLRSAPDLDAPPKVLPRHQGSINAVAFSPNGRWLVTAGDDETPRLWDLTAPDPADSPTFLIGHKGSIDAVAVSSDSRWLATVSGDGTMRLWDLTVADPAAVSILLSGVEEVPIVQVAISSNTRWLVTAAEDVTLQIWDLDSADISDTDRLAILSTIKSGHLDRITTMSISPDSRWLATASVDGTARIWDLTAKDPSETNIVLRGHERSVLSLAFSPDSHRIATGDYDGMLRLWDLTTEDPAATSIALRGHNSLVSSVAFSPDGHWLVTGSAGSTVDLWSLRLEELIELACRTAGRNFAPEEWAQYFPGHVYRETCFNLLAQRRKPL